MTDVKSIDWSLITKYCSHKWARNSHTKFRLLLSPCFGKVQDSCNVPSESDLQHSLHRDQVFIDREKDKLNLCARCAYCGLPRLGVFKWGCVNLLRLREPFPGSRDAILKVKTVAYLLKWKYTLHKAWSSVGFSHAAAWPYISSRTKCQCIWQHNAYEVRMIWPIKTCELWHRHKLFF